MRIGKESKSLEKVVSEKEAEQRRIDALKRSHAKRNYFKNFRTLDFVVPEWEKEREENLMNFDEFAPGTEFEEEEAYEDMEEQSHRKRKITLEKQYSAGYQKAVVTVEGALDEFDDLNDWADASLMKAIESIDGDFIKEQDKRISGRGQGGEKPPKKPQRSPKGAPSKAPKQPKPKPKEQEDANSYGYPFGTDKQWGLIKKKMNFEKLYNAGYLDEYGEPTEKIQNKKQLSEAIKFIFEG